jgi:choline kinase
MKPTLVILAAGMASRYGSMKQTQGFGPGGETIMDYSIYDAIQSGFGKVVFIIRKDFADGFKQVFEPKLKGKIETAYVYQEMDLFLNGYEKPAERTKPWGTGHAMLCAMREVNGNFAVINADDFYGRDGFKKAAHFLVSDCSENLYAIIGYQLAKTLSDHGTVSRGVCQTDAGGNLVDIKERTKIYKENERIVYEEEEIKHAVPFDSPVSMNFWCFHPAVFTKTMEAFQVFLKENISLPKSEFFIPIIAAGFIRDGGKIKVIPTSAQWFGVTYKEDAPSVQYSIDHLIAEGEYPSLLWK